MSMNKAKLSWQPMYFVWDRTIRNTSSEYSHPLVDTINFYNLDASQISPFFSWSTYIYLQMRCSKFYLTIATAFLSGATMTVEAMLSLRLQFIHNFANENSKLRPISCQCSRYLPKWSRLPTIFRFKLLVCFIRTGLLRDLKIRLLFCQCTTRFCWSRLTFADDAVFQQPPRRLSKQALKFE
jgi:hypothetical protein